MIQGLLKQSHLQKLNVCPHEEEYLQDKITEERTFLQNIFFYFQGGVAFGVIGGGITFRFLWN